MSADALQTAIFMLTFVVLLLRWFVGLSYPWRQHPLWTFGLSLSGWIALYLRLVVNRGLDIGSPLDPPATAVWLYILLTQLLAVMYVYWPNRRQR